MTEPQPPMLRRLQHKASGHTQDVTILARQPRIFRSITDLSM